jgi:hypothetical protein
MNPTIACFSLAMLTIFSFCSFLSFMSVNFSLFPLPSSAIKDTVHVAAAFVRPSPTILIPFDSRYHQDKEADYLSSLKLGELELQDSVGRGFEGATNDSKRDKDGCQKT